MSNAYEESTQKNSSIDITANHPRTNFIETLLHLFKGSIGVGLFAMGDAFKNGGIYLSPPLVALMAVICIHSQHILLKCTDVVSREYQETDKRINYAQAVELCFANGYEPLAFMSSKMGAICNFFIFITQLGFCCIYLTFIGTNLQQILMVHDIDIEIHILIMLIWVPIWLVCLIPNLKALAPVSFVANVVFITSFILAIYFAVKDGLPNIEDRKPYTNLQQLALFFCTAIFSYEGIALLLPIKNSMKYPHDFDRPLGVLNIGMSLVVLMYLVCGFFGYLKWGEEVEGSITLNIGDSILAQCTKAFVSFGIMLTYPLQFYVPIEALTPLVLRIFKCQNHPLICEFIFRTFLAAMTLIIAVIFPNIELFISLIGGLCSTALALVFPPVLECVLLYRTIENPKWLKCLKIIKNFVILVLAILACCLGTYQSIAEIVIYFKKEYK